MCENILIMFPKELWLSLLISVLLLSCNEFVEKTDLIQQNDDSLVLESDQVEGVSLVILGTVQDAGSPQIACQKECCKDLFENPDYTRKVVSLGLVDSKNRATYLFEATPDLPSQMERLNQFSKSDLGKVPDGIFLTHAHMGHYTGLMYFGKEAMNAHNVPVYAMPRMQSFLETNGPWSQLVANENIAIRPLLSGGEVQLSDEIYVQPILVPHRDEYSETVGFIIKGPSKSALFIPDIDKWDKWEKDIIGMIKQVDYAFLDATFYDAEEINNRDISEIPHPFVVESMEKFGDLPIEEKEKIYFIHFNHTNPLLTKGSVQREHVLKVGYNIADFEMVIKM